jgi:hypothetical protein
LFGDFVILPFGAAAPLPATPPLVEPTPSEGSGPLGSDALMPAQAAARKYGTPVPILDFAKLAGIVSLTPAGDTYVRLNARGEMVWCSTGYRASQQPDGPSAVTVRLDNGIGRPIPVFPAGSPSSELILPEKVDYLPEPGLLLSFGPAPTATWTQGGRLFTVALNPSILPDVSIERIAPSFSLATS